MKALRVGPITALPYVLTLDDPDRFRKSREVAPALGLVPKRDQSGDRDPQLRITKPSRPSRPAGPGLRGPNGVSCREDR